MAQVGIGDRMFSALCHQALKMPASEVVMSENVPQIFEAGL